MLKGRPWLRWSVIVGAVLVVAALGAVVALLLIVHAPSKGGLVAPTGISIETGRPATTIRKRHHQHAPIGDRPCWSEFGGDAYRSLARPLVTLGIPGKALWARGMKDLMEY